MSDYEYEYILCMSGVDNTVLVCAYKRIAIFIYNTQ